jgi:hypothetical protein
MILTTQDIARILKDKPNAALITKAQAYSRKMLLHLEGIGMEAHLATLPYFEKQEVASVRRKYARTNKDLFTRLHRPIDKVFNARGGSAYYKLPKSQEQQLRDAMTNIEYGYNLRRWIEASWLPAYIRDPMGLVFMEIDENGRAYPTYKSIMDIYDYQVKGRDLDYVVFKTDLKIDAYKKKNSRDYLPVYRVVDDLFDRLVAWDGAIASEVSNQTYPNYWMRVPARINSDLYSSVQGMYVSPDDAIVGIADEFLQEGSFFSIFKKHHFFPKAWQYQRDCIACRGEGKRGGKDCDVCNGTGTAKDWKVNETVLVPVPEKEDPVLAPDIAGYITPDIDGWEAMKTSLADLETLMYQTLWGTEQLTNLDNETATGKFIDTQPVNERLAKFTDAAEEMEECITNWMGQFLFGDTYQGADVHYGRRYMIESPDVIWKKYSDARVAGAPFPALDELLLEYYSTKYAGDSFELQKYTKLMKVEPFVHLTPSQVKALGLPPERYAEKLFFTEWLAQMQDGDIINKPIPTLKAMLSEYAAGQGALPLTPESVTLSNRVAA